MPAHMLKLIDIKLASTIGLVVPMNQMVDLASAGIKQLFALQRSAIDAPASE